MPENYNPHAGGSYMVFRLLLREQLYKEYNL